MKLISHINFNIATLSALTLFVLAAMIDKASKGSIMEFIVLSFFFVLDCTLIRFNWNKRKQLLKGE